MQPPRIMSRWPLVALQVAVAAFVATASVAFEYLFSEEWRRLILVQLTRARVLLGSLTNRAKPFPPINTNPQK
jgi:hypothetical protein